MTKLSKKNNYKIRKRIQNTKKRYIKHGGSSNSVNNVINSTNVQRTDLRRNSESVQQGEKNVSRGIFKRFGNLLNGIKHTLQPHEYEFKTYEDSKQNFENIKLSKPRFSDNYYFYTIIGLPEDMEINI